jgi:hypothetical protein
MDLDGGRFLPHIFHLAHFHASDWRITADTVGGDLRATMLNPRRHWALLYTRGCTCLTIKYMEIRIMDGVRPGWGELCFPHHSSPPCHALSKRARHWLCSKSLPFYDKLRIG